MQIDMTKAIPYEWRKENMGSNDLFSFFSNLKQKLINFFHISKTYYFVSNTSAFKFEFISSEAHKILGYPLKQISKQLLLYKIHPDDFAYYLEFDTYLNSFFQNLTPEKIKKYTATIDYRIKKSDGTYIRILEEVTPIEIDSNGQILKTLGSHTEISDLENSEKAKFSIIGLDGEESFINIELIISKKAS